MSVWFGPKVALSELSCSFGPGVTGLLGPNGAGKTTLMRAITGLVGVNQGTVRIEGRDPRRDRAGATRRMALVPEDEAVPAGLTARQFVRYVADLHRVADRSAPDDALQTVGMLDVADRRVDTFSKGMRQRTKVAAALVSDPHVLVLDEPLNGADPVQRVHLIALFKQLGAQGRTVIVSSHVLNEVERLAERVIVLMHGRLAAAGGHHAIRDAMDDRPRHVLVRSDDGRRLAAALIGLESVAGVTFDAVRDGLVIQTVQARELATALPRLARDASVRLLEVRALDDSLESLFRELVRMTATDAGRDQPAAGRAFVAILVYTLQSCFPRKRWAAVLLPCAGALLFGLLAHAVDDSRRARVRQRRGRRHLRARDADRRARHRRLGARRRGARRHVPLHLAVAHADLADRARPLGRRLDRRARHDRAGVRARRGRRRHARSADAAFVAAAVGSVAYVAIFIAIGCLTRRTAVWSLAFVFLVERLARRRAHRHRAALADVGVARDLRRATSTTRRAASSATGIPQGGERRRPARDRDGRRVARRELAHAPHAPLRRLRLT